jgi:hypothetical protein
MKKRMHGVVLLTTMMMLVILTMLVLTTMESVFLYVKSAHQIKSSHEIFQQMEEMASSMALTNPLCLVQEKNPNQLPELLFAGQGCFMENGQHQFRYIIEDLGAYPCLQVTVNDHLQGSQHWRITLASMQSPRIALQLRYARPVATGKCKLPVAHRISPGVVSWRKCIFPLTPK